MTLSHGHPYLAIPGPSVIPDAVQRAMHRGSPNIYEGELEQMTFALLPKLCEVAGTKGQVAPYIGNGHCAWEAALVNTVAPGDKVLVAGNGAFANGWAEMAQGLGLRVTQLRFGQTAPVDPDALAAALAEDTAQEIRAVLVVHTDTATSVCSPIAPLAQAIADAGHPALLMVDCIASLGCDRFEMDAWGVDVMVSACQKGLMTPAGMAFVWFNARAAERRAALGSVSRYWDWTPRAAPEQLWQAFDGTAPTHHLYGLDAALKMIFEEGLEGVWARHARLSQAIWAAAEAWGAGGPLALNLTDPTIRSHAVTALHLPGGQALALRRWTESQAGVTLGIGLGRTPAEDYFRIGHMGHVNAHMVMGVLGVIQAGLKALGVPFGPGALDAAAEVIAGA